MYQPSTFLRPCAISILTIGLLATDANAHATDAGPKVTAADYDRAASFLPVNVAGKVKNARVDPQWLDGGERFIYRRDGATGPEFVLIESATGKRQPTTDPAASAPNAASGQADTVPSPDGKQAIFVRDFNLWVRDLGSGSERALTQDGVEYFAYGKIVDSSLRTLPMRRAGTPLRPGGVEWSPDSRHLLVTRTDERALGRYPFIESVPFNGSARPVAHELRVALTGDRNQPVAHRSLIEVASGKQRKFELPEGKAFGAYGAAWSADSGHYYFFGTNGQAEAGLLDLDLSSATVRVVFSESNKTFISLNNTIYSSPNVKVLPASNEVIWFSERDGWGHLYLYDLRTGKLKNRITAGNWLVRDIIHVDTARRLIYFTAGGREPGRNPYYRHLYRTGFDGRKLQLLTPEDADHDFSQPLPPIVAAFLGGSSAVMVSPNGKYLVDTYSTVDRPPVSVLRAADGRVIAKLEEADASALFAIGYKPPEQFVAKAADGVTDLYGLLYRPSNFDPAAKYPVIEHLYGGPQTTITYRTFMQAVTDGKYPNAEKELGFVMVVMDVRGTTQRSKAFNDLLYANFADWMIEDHVAVIRQLAASHPYMDLDRVGVEGHSFGGYGSARAILARPDFYKVAVSSAGSQNLQGFYPLYTYTGLPVYSDGSNVNPGYEIPSNYKLADNGALAERLQGKLMIAYGELDENAYPAVTLQFADALIKANKSFDLLYLPRQDHNFARSDYYFIRRKWDYFVEHLLGATPPRDYKIKTP